jgi:hypothetical protein
MDRSRGPALPPLFAWEMRARPTPGRAEQHLAHLYWNQRPAEISRKAGIVHRQLGHSPFLPATGSLADLIRNPNRALTHQPNTGRPLARCPPKAGPFPATPGPNPAG